MAEEKNLPATKTINVEIADASHLPVLYINAVKAKLKCSEEGGAHEKWGFYVSGKLVGWSMRSRSLRGNEQISPGILSMMAREMRCSTGTWKRILEYTRTRRDYLNELLHNGHITEEERGEALKEG